MRRALSLLVCWAFRWLDGKDGGLLAAETEHAAADQPVPYWPTVEPGAIRHGPPVSDPIDGLAAAITCTWCRPVRRGLCSCTGLCGDGRCIRGGALRLTGADREILEGKRLP